MEVHPPRHAINNWRDFVLHMATIVLGLLIAISLEQSVEWLHRSEKRRQLQGDLRQEMRANDAQLGEDIKFCSADAEWCLDQAQRIQAALHANNGASLTYEEARLKGLRHLLPNDSVWQHARESGSAALLPRAQAQCYTLLYRIRERLVESYKDWNEARIARNVITKKFAHTYDGPPDFSQMTSAQLDDLATAFAREAVTARYEMAYLGSMTAVQKMLEDGSTSQEEIGKAMFDSRNPVRFGSWNPVATPTKPP
jgi:hypothetical protein